MNIKLELVATDVDSGDMIFHGEYLTQESLEEDLGKLESAIEGAEEKNKDLADQLRSDESKAEELEN